MILTKNAFFKAMGTQGMALTYDDVRLLAGKSLVTTRSVDIRSKFSKNTPLLVPITSAAMDTVTTANMAIEMAKLGGIGVVHAGLQPEEQYHEVRKVKLHLNGKIEKPITVTKSQTLQDVIAMCNERGFQFRSFPVIDSAKKCIGLITRRDFEFALDSTKKVGSAMTPIAQATTAGAGTQIDRAFQIMQKNRVGALPLLDKDGTITGMYELSDVVRLLGGNPDNYNIDDAGRLRVAAAVPTDDGAIERIERMEKYLDVAVIDTAQGDSEFAFDTLKKVKRRFPKLDVVVGNISNPESAQALADAGADGIKVGQGPGSICTTRIETGIGTPQVTAVYECAQAVKKYGIPIIADGGITNAGDVSIAIAAGASSVMLGSGLAGTKETPGEIIMSEDHTMVKIYRGMGSASAMKDSAASRSRYGVDMASSGKPLAEGVESHVPYKGPVSDVMDHYIKALRKSMSYVGSKDIRTHQSSARFVRITHAGIRESHPHDVKVT